jgi:hypothetical protein
MRTDRGALSRLTVILIGLAGAPASADVMIDMPRPPAAPVSVRPPGGAAAIDARVNDDYRETDLGRLALARYVSARYRAYATHFDPLPLVFYYTNAPGYGYGYPYRYGYYGYGYGFGFPFASTCFWGS